VGALKGFFMFEKIKSQGREEQTQKNKIHYQQVNKNGGLPSLEPVFVFLMYG
jgi:hypothetical protein